MAFPPDQTHDLLQIPAEAQIRNRHNWVSTSVLSVTRPGQSGRIYYRPADSANLKKIAFINLDSEKIHWAQHI
jgi:hypothetical protein